MNIAGKEYTRAQALERVGNLTQLGGARHYTLSEGRAKGTAAVDVETGTGFRFTVLPDRGMDMPAATFNGINLVYRTPNGEANPAFYDPHGSEWLRAFFGGLLTTCGLTHLGGSVKDGAEELGVHGRHTGVPAQQVVDLSGWEGDEYVIRLRGVMEECLLFGDNIRLTRTITTRIGSRRLEIVDQVENFGFKKSPFHILYHINPGFPLLGPESEFVVSSREVKPHREADAPGIPDCRRFSCPIPDFTELNFTHMIEPDGDGRGYAGMLNRPLAGGLGLYIAFDARELPFLNEWKQMGQGDYVVGMEPCNAPCENRVMLREMGLLKHLEPGEKREIRVEIGVLTGPAELDAFAKKATRHCHI